MIELPNRLVSCSQALTKMGGVPGIHDFQENLETRLPALYIFHTLAPVLVSFPDHFSPHGKNWSGERPFSFPVVAKNCDVTLVGL